MPTCKYSNLYRKSTLISFRCQCICRENFMPLLFLFAIEITLFPVSVHVPTTPFFSSMILPVRTLILH